MSLSGLNVQQNLGAKSPVEAVERLNQIGRTLLQEDPQSAQRRFQHALQIASQINDTPGAAQAHSGLAVVYQSLGMADRATEHAQSAQDLCFVLENPEHVGNIFQNLGDMYAQRGEREAALAAYKQALSRHEMGRDRSGQVLTYQSVGELHALSGLHDAALEAYLKAAQLAQTTESPKQLANLYISIAALYYEQDLTAQAIDYTQKASQLTRTLEDDHLLAKTHNLLGILNKVGGENDRALAHYGEAIKLRQALNDQKGLADTHHNIGILYEQQNEIDYALHYYSQALAMRREIEDTEGLIRSFAVLGTAHRQIQRFEMAGNYLHRAMDLAVENHSVVMEGNLHFELSQLYSEMGDYEPALFHHRRHATIRQFIFSERRSAQIAHAQTKYAAYRELQKTEVARLQTDEIEQRITERIRPIEDTLHQVQMEAAKLEETLAEESGVSDLKSQVIRLVSHELRTPLAVIANAAYIIERFDTQLEASKRESNFGRIKESVRYMKQVLDDVAWADTAAMSTVTVRLKPIPMPLLREQVIEEMSIDARERDRLLVSTPDVDDAVAVDIKLVQQIVNHLVSNALKFSQQAGTLVELDIEYEQAVMTITVSDQGIGVPKADQERLTEMFFRAGNVGNIHGLGLGLAIVQRLTDAMHGTLRLESAGENKGCQVTIVLPVGGQNSAEPTPHVQINPRVLA